MAEISPVRRLPAAGLMALPTWRFDAATSAAAVGLRLAASWITVWVGVFAVVGWLFIAGFAGFNH